jgi:ABC-type multidrug transport system ATPase subunit
VTVPLLRLAGISKAYPAAGRRGARHLQVLDRVDFELETGEVLVVVGANGAGKTTLLKIIATLTLPDGGSVEIDGRSIRTGADVRKQIGFASGDERMLFPRLTGLDNLRFFAALYALSRSVTALRIEELAVALDLRAELERPVDRCSSGGRVRLGLARALMHRPRLLLLDEPTRSLDAAHRAAVEAIVRSCAAEGSAVVMVTHRLDEPERLSAKVGVLEAGTLLFGGDPRVSRGPVGARPA